MSGRLKWSQKEEQLILKLRDTEKLKSWVRISQQVNTISPFERRTPKQCRDRYINFIRFQKNGAQSDEDHNINLMMLVIFFVKQGPSWKKIAQHFPSHSENSLKNKMYSLLRKLTIKISSLNKLKNRRAVNLKIMKSSIVDLRNKLLVSDEKDVRNYIQILKMFWMSLESLERGEQISDPILNDLKNKIIQKRYFQAADNFQLLQKGYKPAQLLVMKEQQFSKIIQDVLKLHQTQNSQSQRNPFDASSRNPKSLIPQESRTMQNSNQREVHLTTIKFNNYFYKFPKEVLQMIPLGQIEPSLTIFRPNTFEDLEEEIRIIEGSKRQEKNNLEFI